MAGFNGASQAIGVGIYYASGVISCRNVRVRISRQVADPNPPPTPPKLTGFQVQANVQGSTKFEFDHCTASVGHNVGTNFGFDIRMGEGVFLRNCDVFADIGVNLHPGLGEHIQFWGIDNLVGDFSNYVVVTTDDPMAWVTLGYIRGGMLVNGRAVQVDPKAGRIAGLRIDGVIFSNSDRAIILSNTGGGILDKVSIQNCELTDGHVGSSLVQIDNGVSGWVVQACTIGNGVYGTPGQVSDYGIGISGTASDRFVIEGNDLRGNSIGPIQDLSTGINKVKRSNLFPAAVPSIALAAQLDDTAQGTSKARVRAPSSILATELNASFGADGNYLTTASAQFLVRVNGSALAQSVTVPSGSSSASTAITPPVLIAQNDRVTVDHVTGNNEGGAIQVQIRGRQIDA